MKTRYRIAALIVAGSAVVAASPAMAATTTINVSTPKTDMFAFKGMPAKLKPGTYKFVYKNDSGIDHNLKVGSVSTPNFDKGSKTITVTLKKGTTAYICTVAGHGKMGMKGNITVK
jgi:uncharacterized cupredoxin-like copper-binding protein